MGVRSDIIETITIRGQPITLDIREELEQYDFGYGARWNENKLIARSPFRDDRSPSFYVNFTGKYAGRWGDSGALDPKYSSGDLAFLIAQLEGISYDEACVYLFDKYGSRFIIEDTSEEIIIPTVKLKEDRRSLPQLDTSVFIKAPSKYLESRGISKETQDHFNIGYNPNNKGYTAICWTSHLTGEILSIKYRSTSGKDMFYEKGSRGINGLVFGLFHVKHIHSESIVICEGEIDALSFIEEGIPAVAVGTASISRKQAEIIKYYGFRKIYLGGDNDEAGRIFNDQMEGIFARHCDVMEINYGRYKDANEVLTKGNEGQLRQICDNAKRKSIKLL